MRKYTRVEPDGPSDVEGAEFVTMTPHPALAHGEALGGLLGGQKGLVEQRGLQGGSFPPPTSSSVG